MTDTVQAAATSTGGGWAPGSQIVVRDAVWLVRTATATEHDGDKISAVGVSPLVQDQEATFFTKLDDVAPLRPEDTELVADVSEHCRTSRLFLEAVLRKTPLPQSEHGLALAGDFLLNQLPYQLRPAELALRGLRPRLLIADVVGLGKTLEIGLTLAELIRRGRGERILVVVPQQVLDQFQRELWSRFAIPLIRLDTVGIQRIQQEIPAGRNPFTYHRRVIVSVDTLKNVGRYRHHLRTVRWDAVVIDESHNLMGGTNLRSQLARELAPRTDALILASATPHNGDSKSFGELIDLLDPAAITDTDDFRAEEIAHLYIRRTKISSEVRDHVRDNWADRGPSEPIRCVATDAEERIFAELTEHWLAPGATPATDRLFPYNLLKSFLSSHHALAATVRNRLRSATVEAERDALARLRDFAEAMTDEDSAKLRGLVGKLRDWHIGPNSTERVVVFSERVATLKWLAAVVPPLLGFDEKAGKRAVRVLHGGVSDQDEQRFLEEFGLEQNDVRILFTGDVASEGVNLHQQCHQLVHYDIPWSLIRIEQRNGRIDRYGQTREPEFAALILTSAAPDAKDDTTVAEKLLAREAAAHANLGTAEAVTGLYSAKKEEDRLVQDLLAGKTVDESIDAAGEPDVLGEILGEVTPPQVASQPVLTQVPSLFDSTRSFVDEALRALYQSGEEIDLGRDGEIMRFAPPLELRRRLSVLPPSYVREQRLEERLLLTFDRETAGDYLRKAVRTKDSNWPAVSFVSPLHPVLDWLADRLLVRLGRQQAFAIHADVAEPVFLVQGSYANALGRTTVVSWMAVSGLSGQPRVEDMFDALAAAGIRPGMHNRGVSRDLSLVQATIEDAVAVARRHVDEHKKTWADEVEASLEEHRKRVRRWEQLALDIEGATASNGKRKAASDTADQQRHLIESLKISGPPFLRVLGVLVGGAS